MAEPIDMSEAITEVRLLPSGERMGYSTSYLETYIFDLIEEINNLQARVDALENP